MKVSDEEIFSLREQGLSCRAIAEYFTNLGKEISGAKISYRCKKIYNEKGKKEPKAKPGPKENKSITNEEIFELREQGLSCRAIAEYFTNLGKEISGAKISYRCKRIYEEKGKKEPKVKTGIKKNISDEKIFSLREQGLSYRAIADYFINLGENITRTGISYRCEKIYEERGEKKAKEKKIEHKVKANIRDEEIYELREQGLTYEAIAQYFIKQGEYISRQSICNRCKKIYKEKEKEEPKVKVMSKIEATDEEIYKLREQGLTYKAMVEYFSSQGKNINYNTICKRCKTIYEERGGRVPKIKSPLQKVIADKEIYELRKQGLSYQEIAEYFTNQGTKIGWGSIRNRCKKIYEGKGTKEPKVKTGPKEKITNEEIYELREQGLTYEAIREHFISQGKKISRNSIYSKCKEVYEGREKPKIKRKPRSKKNNTINEEKVEQSINNKDLAKAIMSLMVTRKANLEQIKKMAEIYEVDLEEVLNNFIDER